MDMKTRIFFFIIGTVVFFMVQCKKENNPPPAPVPPKTIEVIINDIPYPTEKFLRIGYTLRFWEFEKDGLKLKRIFVRDSSSKKDLMILTENEFPVIFKDPIPPMPYFIFDKLTHYYLSIQLPIPLEDQKPTLVTHLFEFRDTIHNKIITVEGAAFSPRLNEAPAVISSPVKGAHWMFMSQSTMGYHFYALLFMNGKIWRSERFAFDNGQLNDDLTTYLSGSPQVNESYYCYGDTLYAVADGVIIKVQDGLPENNGDLHDVTLNSINEYEGNSLILDIGSGRFAGYAHCMPGSFFVQDGDTVKEGDPVARLGNSGNSGMPHLHFQITDSADFLFSQGIPFVLKEYRKINEFDPNWNLLNPPPETVYNSMMEMLTVIDL
jgi:hypothetical protein